jgi:hypothetical protein
MIGTLGRRHWSPGLPLDTLCQRENLGYTCGLASSGESAAANRGLIANSADADPQSNNSF